MRLYNYMTMTLFALVALLLAIAIFLHVAHASHASEQDKFKAFGQEYCTQIDQYEYCLTFHRLPFGPGYVFDLRLEWTDVEAIVGPVDRGEMSMGTGHSRDGQGFTMDRGDFIGLFRQGGLELYTGQLRMEAKPGE